MMKNSLKLLPDLEKIGTYDCGAQLGSVLKPAHATASIEEADKDGRTPIMIAAMLNRHRKLEILLDTYTSWSTK